MIDFQKYISNWEIYFSCDNEQYYWTTLVMLRSNNILWHTIGLSCDNFVWPSYVYVHTNVFICMKAHMFTSCKYISHRYCHIFDHFLRLWHSLVFLSVYVVHIHIFWHVLFIIQILLYAWAYLKLLKHWFRWKIMLLQIIFSMLHSKYVHMFELIGQNKIHSRLVFNYKTNCEQVKKRFCHWLYFLRYCINIRIVVLYYLIIRQLS